MISVSSDFTSVFVDTAPPSACTARFGVSWQQCLPLLYPQILPLYLSIRLLPQRVQHASAYPGSNVSHDKFHLLYSLLVFSHTNKSTKDNLKFHFITQFNLQPHYSLLQACPTLTQKRTQLCRLSGSLTGWISGLSVSWVAETRSERDRRSITVKLSNKAKQFLPCTLLFGFIPP